MNLAEKLVEWYKSAGMTCATAESCTGGGIGAAITSAPGASEIFRGGVIAYANEVKKRLLGVNEETLSKFGAVSSQTAAEMATGAKRLLGVDVAVSVTGVAGPDGGSPEKPVGTVWFGLASPGGVRTERKLFIGDREAVRRMTTEHAIGMLTTAAIF